MIKNIFTKNLNLLAPCSNEYLFNYIYLLGYTDEDLRNSQNYNNIKYEVIEVLKQLFIIEVIEVQNWCNNSELNNKYLTIEDTIKNIDKIWFEGATFPDFYQMVLFGTPKWYTDKLWELGITHTTNWENFVSDKIGDLKQWIEDNKPK